jgi:hypothetical protein
MMTGSGSSGSIIAHLLLSFTTTLRETDTFMTFKTEGLPTTISELLLFFHYWLDNTMIMNLPVDLYMAQRRKTKFMLIWDNEDGFLGQQLYDKPDQHSYQLSRFFLNENYIKAADGTVPLLVYLYKDGTGRTKLPLPGEYIKKLKDNMLNWYGVRIKIGFLYIDYKNNFKYPEY